MYITASKLYSYIQCQHRVWRDAHGPQDEKIQETNPFVQLLWDKGIAHEENIVQTLGKFMDLSKGSLDERFGQTLLSLKNKEPLIYQGVLRYGNLLGIPDLIKLQPDGTYVPIEIKSGRGYEGADGEGDDNSHSLKKSYAVQLGLYIELLELLGFEHANKAAVIDGHGNLVEYDLNQPMGKRTSQTYWDFYLQVKSNAALLIKGQAENKPALAGICKLCPWYTSCSKWVKDNSDPTELFYLGRAKRDVLAEDLGIFKTQDALTLDIESVLAQKKRDKTFLSGIGEATLRKIVDRARIMHETKLPVLYKKITFPNVSYELFFDIEDDPTREFVYLHGVYERHNGNERFIDFTAAELTPAAEKDAWQRFWNYIKTLPADDYAVYYYSPHEKTTYKNLQRLYPDVISESELEDFFANPNVIDLYNQVVLKYTDWPVSSYGLKALATYCGFSWRDETPSGALSIQWYNTYLETKDPKILERILLYNEDDCKATMVIKDYIKKM